MITKVYDIQQHPYNHSDHKFLCITNRDTYFVLEDSDTVDELVRRWNYWNGCKIDRDLINKSVFYDLLRQYRNGNLEYCLVFSSEPSNSSISKCTCDLWKGCTCEYGQAELKKEREKNANKY